MPDLADYPSGRRRLSREVCEVEKPDVSAVLDATYLEEAEDRYLHVSQHTEADAQADGEVEEWTAALQPLPTLTLQDATDSLRRIAYHRRNVAKVKAEADDLLDSLHAQIDQILAWEAGVIKDRESRIAFHENRLIAYYKLNPPSKTQTLKLPGGTVAMRQPPPKWVYPDEKALIGDLDQLRHPAIMHRPVLDKDKLKAMAEVRPDGQVLVPETGQVLSGVRVEDQPPVFTVAVKGL